MYTELYPGHVLTERPTYLKNGGKSKQQTLDKNWTSITNTKRSSDMKAI